MREYSTPPTLPAPSRGNLTDDVVENARVAPGTAQFARRTPTGWTDVSCAAFLDQVRAVARGLVAAGVAAGDRVALVSRTRYEWTLVDYATWFAGGVGVPVYESSTAEQLGWVLADSGAVAVVVETAEHAARVAAARAALVAAGGNDPVRHVWCLEGAHGPDGPDGAHGGRGPAVPLLGALGAGVDDAELERRRTARGPGDAATIVYTSGTTHRPRGCVLTHANLAVAVDAATSELGVLFDAEDAATLLFLPLAHVFARVVQIGCVRSRTRMGHSADMSALSADLDSLGATFVLAVPRVFEKIFNTASQRATADGHGARFEKAAEAAIAWSRALDRSRVPLRVRLEHAARSRWVQAPVRAALGSRCVHAVSGGAPLGERLGHLYRGIGITVYEGWGSTETTAAITANAPGAHKVGTVGRPLPGAAVRVADDGELLVRGGQVFAGYWGDEQATARALDPHGWFHTGDVGEVDDEGFVRVTGRKEEILVTAGGKSVAPAVLEDLVRAHPLVSQCLVVGDGRPFVAALVTIDPEAFAAWAGPRGKRGGVADHVDDPDLRAEVDAAVEAANRAVSRAEAIRTFRILRRDWTEEAGQLTPSLKLRRSVVVRESREQIAALYR